jgi:phage shock protein PspC (stress-responsive transcriptional regulator)
MRKLTKDSHNKMVCGVCAGIAKYFNVDPTLVRVMWAVGSLFTAVFGGLIAYIVVAVIVPYDYEVGAE